MQYYRIQTEKTIFLDDLLDCSILKTGDLILFKAYNNFNSIFHGSYFGHIGIVVVVNDIPMLFEANGIERVPLKSHHNKNGIFLTPVADRIKKYKGRAFLKQLSTSIDPEIISGFFDFIHLALKEFKYDYNVISAGFRKLFGMEKCGKNTDCGQIVFLSLIKLGLIEESEWSVSRLHHLKFVCAVEKLTESRCYLPLVEIIDHPFDI